MKNIKIDKKIVKNSQKYNGKFNFKNDEKNKKICEKYTKNAKNMKKIDSEKLIKKICVTDEFGKKIRINYYLLSSKINLNYGIKVTKTNPHGEEIESAGILRISPAKTVTIKILNKLASGAVTPIALNDSIIEIFDELSCEIASNFHFTLKNHADK
jgi:hypothetical protein